MDDCVVLVAGGPEELWPEISTDKIERDRWIGIDRGAWRLLERGIEMDLAVGDFDSLSKKEREILSEKVKEMMIVPPEKDQTDTELGLELALDRYPRAEKYQLIGGTGGRLDHLLANLFVVYQPRFSSLIGRLEVVDRWNHICFYQPGVYQIMREENKDYLTFVCLTPVEKLSLHDVKYPLVKKDIRVPSSLTSNEFLHDQASFSFTSGLVAVIQSRDMVK